MAKYQSLQERYASIHEDIAPLPAAVVSSPAAIAPASPSKTEMEPVMTPSENSEDSTRPELLAYVGKHMDKLSSENLKQIYRLVSRLILDQEQGRLIYRK